MSRAAHTPRAYWGRGAALACLAALLLIATAPAALLQAQGPTWSPPHSLGRYWFPAVAADPQGRAHIAWSSGADGFDTVMYAVWSPETGMSMPVDVHAQDQFQGSEASRPNLYAAPDGTLHMTYRFTRLHYAASPADDVLMPQAWSTPADLAEAGYFTAITADSTGVLHLLTTQNVVEETCALCLHLFYQNSHDNGMTWSDVTDLSVISTGTAKPQMVVDAADGIHVVYESGYGGTLGQLSGPTEVRYVRSTDQGERWSAPVVLDLPLEPDDRPGSRNITIEIDKNGRLLVVFLDANRDAIYYRLSEDEGASWGSGQRIPSLFSALAVYPSTLDSYSMARDSLGNVHLVLSGRQSEEESNLHLLHLVWDGSGWSPPAAIASYTEDAPEWPRIAVANGNRLFVVWFVRDAEGLFRSDSGDYAVYFSTRLLDAPLATPTPFSVQRQAPVVSTPTPPAEVAAAVAAATMTAAATPPPALASPTPLPAELLRPPTRLASLQNIRSENDEMLLLVAATLPAAVLIMIFLLVRRARARRQFP